MLSRLIATSHISSPRKGIPSPHPARFSTQTSFNSVSRVEFIKRVHNINKIAPLRRHFTTEEPVKSEEKVDAKPTSNEKIVGSSKKHEFQAETKKILNIVVRSLYTEKEVFVRELISNASDALEKVRHFTLSNKGIENSDAPLEINVFTDDATKTLIIQDNGIGMSEDEMVTNLGRIGHSGSAEFIKNLSNKDTAAIIGQFGVGFYSCFMAASKVTVYSKSATPGSKGFCWTSDGSGSYEISEAEGVERGTKIVLQLNTESKKFSSASEIENIIKKYSNFVGFSIKVNGKQVNTIRALWSLPKDQVQQKDHNEFFKFIAHTYQDPKYHLHFTTDSPISIQALLYAPKQNPERFGLGRQEPGLNLFSRKVLIQPKAKGLLPDWLRFIQGVVDSEDIPLNISREFLQDSNLIKRIGNVITRRILKWLDEESKKDPKEYQEFFKEFGVYFKEGIASEPGLKEEIGQLLRYESSKTKDGELTSLDEYISRMPEEQQQIYYLNAPSRSLAEASPYFEAFKANNQEVLFLYSPFDDFVMTNNLNEYKGKKIVSAEVAKVPVKEDTNTEGALTSEEVSELVKHMKETLEAKVSTIKASDRLVESPVVIVGNEATAFRRMMKYVDPAHSPGLAKQPLEINPKHPVIKKLHRAYNTKPKLAGIIANQLFDNALVSAGLMDDARTMILRMNTILASALENPSDVNTDA